MIDRQNPDPKERDLVFERMRREAEDVIRVEPTMAGFIYSTILNHVTFESAVVHRIAARLAHSDVQGALVRQAFLDLLAKDGDLSAALRADVLAVLDRDPACNRVLEPVLYFKGYHAIQTHRLAHACWRAGRHDFAFYLQSRSSALFQTDIHPASHIGKGILLDHATSLNIGATAIVGDDVSMLHHVTLGGTGRYRDERHPKIGSGVLIGAGAKILGNIEVGSCSRIAAGSVVLDQVPNNKTVAGVPAKIVADSGCAEPARTIEEVLAAKPAAGIGTGRNIVGLRHVYADARDRQQIV